MNAEKLNINAFNQAYFIGIGGIGMSAIARYFLTKDWIVGGYDKTPSKLTDTLIEEGAIIHFQDLGSQLPAEFKIPERTLVIYTPAIPLNMGELLYLKQHDYAVLKRSEVLGMITRDSKALCVAGTHGKTTTSTMIAHVLNESTLRCSAFLGGISSNFNSNFIGDTQSELTVIEADEFDRSFLRLKPYASIITTTDSDHLDIYNDEQRFLQSFQDYANLIQEVMVHHVDVRLNHKKAISYAMNKEADFTGGNEQFENGFYKIDINTPNGIWKNVVLGLPGSHNAENAIACVAILLQIGLSEKEIRNGLASFKGVKRRFEYQIKKNSLIYIDDYAHHPTEIKALIDAVKSLYPGKKIKGIFQPHLFSRTRDFFDDFVTQLSRLDELVLLPIYPAREEPIEGVTSEAVLDKVSLSIKSVLDPAKAIDSCDREWEGVLLTIGAGDIDRIVEPLKNKLL